MPPSLGLASIGLQWTENVGHLRHGVVGGVLTFCRVGNERARLFANVGNWVGQTRGGYCVFVYGMEAYLSH